jgi:Leucine-rich repeat (LRR) protein
VTFVSNGMLTVRRLRRAVRTGELKLIRKGLTALPPEVGQLTLLEALTLEDNQLTALPPEIGKLTKLRTLWLNNNQLTALPPEIGQLTELETLSLDSNQLTALPPEIGKLTKLRTLWLDNNQLTALPPEIGQLTELETLSLGSNQLTALPPEIGQLTELETLSLSSNQLTALPPEIGQLAELRMLWLEKNQLTALPPEIGQLTLLETLILENNQLTALPPEIGSLLIEGLNIFLRHNPLRRRYRNLSRRDLGAQLIRRLDPAKRQQVTFDRWSSEDWRTVIITIVGTFVANVVTLLYVGLALASVRSSKVRTADEADYAVVAVITGAVGLTVILYSYLGRQYTFSSWMRRFIWFTILLMGMSVLFVALFLVGKAAGIK